MTTRLYGPTTTGSVVRGILMMTMRTPADASDALEQAGFQ